MAESFFPDKSIIPKYSVFTIPYSVVRTQNSQRKQPKTASGLSNQWNHPLTLYNSVIYSKSFRNISLFPADIPGYIIYNVSIIALANDGKTISHPISISGHTNVIMSSPAVSMMLPILFLCKSFGSSMGLTFELQGAYRNTR